MAMHSSSQTYKNFLQFTEPVYKSHFFKEFRNSVYDDHASRVSGTMATWLLKMHTPKIASFVYLNYHSHYNGTKVLIRENNSQGDILAQFTINKTQKNRTSLFPLRKIDKKTNIYIETQNDAIAKEVNLLNLYWVGFIEDMPGRDLQGWSNINSEFINALNTPTETVPIMAENPEYMKRATQVFNRGSFLDKIDTVQSGTPESLNEWNQNWSKDRLGLSKWIVDKKKPIDRAYFSEQGMASDLR